jgi:ferredoxin-NADP reductase
MPSVTWYPLVLKHILKETETTRRFFFQLESEKPFEYLPGQFLTCDLPIGEKRLQRWRSYSIANLGNPSNEIEFCISHKQDGLASDYFFNQIKPGDSFKCKGPEGNFILPEGGYTNLVLICTGTGMAPFRPMLQQMMQQSHPYHSIHLVFGTRHYRDLIYTDDIAGWNGGIRQFKSHLCLSREAAPAVRYPEDSIYYQAYVHEAYTQIIQNTNAEKNSYLFMICGWSQMIDQAVLRLFSQLGFGRDQIRYELYG